MTTVVLGDGSKFDIEREFWCEHCHDWRDVHVDAELNCIICDECNVTVAQYKDREVFPSLEDAAHPISLWFELSYAQFLTVPRLVMQSMSIEWQRKMAALLQEMDDTFDWRPKEGRYWVRLKDARGRYTDAPLDDYRHGDIAHLRWDRQESKTA